ncbi:hypothetical protein M8J76_006218 [Diaphorina citri]|nr:hypothetical protein M8J75_002476 [Diaphorina citri]KAI5744891.1 hypothetical protein M8J76_006218 [Diaphorina citri]
MGPKTISDAKSKKSKAHTKHLPVEKIVPPTVSPIVLDKSGNILVHILAKPGAKTNAITDVTQDRIGVQINAPPVDGEANTELVKYLSKLLGLRKSDVSLDKGSKSRQKTICINKDACSLDDVHNKLMNEAKKQ